MCIHAHVCIYTDLAKPLIIRIRLLTHTLALNTQVIEPRGGTRAV